MTPQANKVLDIIKRDGHITRLSAMHYKISNVSARIAELRIEGRLNIVAIKAKDADGQAYSRWTLMSRFPQVAQDELFVRAA
jgi:hypothetical protein